MLYKVSFERSGQRPYDQRNLKYLLWSFPGKVCRPLSYPRSRYRVAFPAYNQHDHQLVLLSHLRMREDAVQHLGHIWLQLFPEVYHTLVVVGYRETKGRKRIRLGALPALWVCHQCQWRLLPCWKWCSTCKYLRRRSNTTAFM